VRVTGTDERDRQRDITAVVLKVLGVAVAVGLVVGLGAWVMVKALGLDSAETIGPGAGQVQPVTPLPTTALPVPTESALPTPDNTGLVTRTGAPSGDLYLNATPVIVSPMERINLTGRWPGHDNESLLVQRFEDGAWADFGVQARVNVGTFETYVMTGRQGDQRFRVFDPETKTASNDVTVTVGS
jgi:hypothetical protein